LKQRVKTVSDHAIYHERAACIANLAEKQLTPPVSIDIDRINQLKPRDNVQVLSIGYVRQRLVKITVHILTSHECDHVLQV
jgi:hypothetical protein